MGTRSRTATPQQWTHVELVKLVVDLAREGERDEHRLRAKVLFQTLQIESERRR